jgi:signal peptidase I
MELQGSKAGGVRGGRFGPGEIKPETRTGYILFCTLLWSTISFLLLHQFVLTAVVVEGQSMAPTLKPGNCRLVNCWLPLFRDYHRGDIVVVRDRKRGELLVKRIVGLPSDSIQVSGGKVRINGQPLTEAYLPSPTYTEAGRMTSHVYEVAKDSYFVLGDNRPVSDDSRSYGAVKRSDLVGLISR